MPRLTYHTATDPIKIDPKTLDPNKPLSICACGLSQKFPICDGSHKPCRVNEQADTLYIYDRTNKTVIDTKPDASHA